MPYVGMPESTSSIAVMKQTALMEDYERGLLEPEYYPDPALFRDSLEYMSNDEEELTKNLNSNKNTIRVLAPYLKIMRKQILKSAIKIPKSQKRETKVLFHKKPVQENVANFNPNLSGKNELLTSIQETGDVLKTVLRAKCVVSYVVSRSMNEIYQIPCHVESSTSSLSWKIEPGTTMAAFTAYSKECVLTENVNVDQRFPKGLGYPDSLLQYGLCVPIKTPDHKVVGVYELSRDAYDEAFDSRDVQLVLALTAWMGVAILQNSLHNNLAEQQELTNYLLQLTRHYHSGKVSIDKTYSDIVIFAREIVKAERCTIFVVETHKNDGSLTVEEFEQGIDDSRAMFKRRSKKYVSNDDSLFGKIFFHKKIINETINNNEMSIDNVRSVLCVPILHGEDVLGALKLTNKKGTVSFDIDDINTAKIFTEFLGINIYHTKLNDNLKQSELHRRVLQEMLFHHIQPCPHDQEEVQNQSTDLPENFFSLTWYPLPDQMPKLVEMTVNMFHSILGDSFMTMNNVPKFILTVKNCYRPNPYHNFLHAFTVAHSMANIISRYHKVFTGLERKGLMVAALCHDLDHRGYNNNFLQLTRHYLADLYETSPLENHHFAVTKMILYQCKMFRYLNSSIYNELLAEIYEDVIATDLSLYFQCKRELLGIADLKSFTFKNLRHRRLVKSLMMTACDISGQTKPLPICNTITEDVYEEFFTQGDIEKRMGFIPLPTMDRDKGNMLAENQVQFISVVVLPCIQTVARIFGTLGPLVWSTKTLIKQYKEIVANKDKANWKPTGSVASAPK